VGLGFPTKGGESPQKIWVVGCEASRSKKHATHDIGFQFSTIYTYTLQDLLYFNDESYARELTRLKEVITHVTHLDGKPV
jgi:hypothetical protein